MEIKKWQYYTDLVRGDEHLEKMLAHRGEQGWELVAVLPKKSSPVKGDPTAESWTLIFKQPSP
jgi:hypothetical protein